MALSPFGAPGNSPPSEMAMGLEFPDGRIVLLTDVLERQEATVLQLLFVTSCRCFDYSQGCHRPWLPDCPGWKTGGVRGTVDWAGGPLRLTAILLLVASHAV